MTDALLTPGELQRYARHLTLAEVGVAGQERLRGARVLLVGAGGLGSPAALYLAAAGIGTLGIVDDDEVDLSNLQRQVLHDSGAIGHPKVESARARIAALNPHVTVEAHRIRLSASNARALVARYDLVIDGSDNFPTRYLVNDACVLERKPLVYGSILRFEGQVSLFSVPGGPCYRCLFQEPPPPELVPSCADAGVIGVLPGIVGSLQALEAIKWVLGVGDSLAGRLLLFDALTLRFREIAVSRDRECAACGDRPTMTDLIDYDDFCGVRMPKGEGMEADVTPAMVAASVTAGKELFLLDVREPWEAGIAQIPGSTLIPLGQLPGRMDELPRQVDIVTICHHGVRSISARDLLRRTGFGRVRSLEGGIDAWALAVDPGMPQY